MQPTWWQGSSTTVSTTLHDIRRGWTGLQALQEQKEQLQQQLSAVKESGQEVHQRLSTAQQEHQAASKAASKQLHTLRDKLRPTGLQLPSSSKEAQELVQQLQQKAQEQPERWALSGWLLHLHLHLQQR